MARAGGPLRVRFAPSPTGSLHLGNARTALFNWLVARHSGGAFVLRIEDTDIDREVAGAESGILTDLRWLGLDWDEGPDIGGPYGPYRQSQRSQLYAGAARRLLASGRAYRCFCDIDPARIERSGEGRPDPCAALPAEAAQARERAGDACAVRFRTAREDDAPGARVVFQDGLRGEISVALRDLGDGVLLRRDGRPTYNFAVVVDDAAMRIDLVLRGDDHLSNTPRQALYFDALDERRPAFAHLPMVLGPDGEKLSKRHGAVTVAELREAGYPVAAVWNALALLGWSPGGDEVLVDRERLLRDFDVQRVGKSAAVFDPTRLAWIANRHRLEQSAESLGGEVAARLERSGRLPEGASIREDAARWRAGLAELVRSATAALADAESRAAGLFWRGGESSDPDVAGALAGDGARVAEELTALLEGRADLADPAAWADVKRLLRERTGLKGAALFHPLRAVLTGALSGPELDRLVPLIAEGAELFPGRIASLHERVRACRGRS